VIIAIHINCNVHWIINKFATNKKELYCRTYQDPSLTRTVACKKLESSKALSNKNLSECDKGCLILTIGIFPRHHDLLQQNGLSEDAVHRFV